MHGVCVLRPDFYCVVVKVGQRQADLGSLFGSHLLPVHGDSAVDQFFARRPSMALLYSVRDEHSKAVGDKVAALFEAARKDAEAAYAEAQKDAKPKKGQAKPTAEEAEAAKEAAIAALIKPVPQGELARLRSDNRARELDDKRALTDLQWRLDHFFQSAAPQMELAI